MSDHTKGTYNTLIVTVGLPRSGKSTWASEASKQLDSPIVNPDSVRLAVTGKRFLPSAEPIVWATIQYMIRALFHAGHDTVILDATNTTKARRKLWLEECEKGYYGNDAKVCFVIFDTNPEECKRRAIATNMEDLLPIIDGMDASYEPLDQTEEPHHSVKDTMAGILGFI